MSTVRYVHQELGETVEAIGGSYTLTKEVRLPWIGPPAGEVLYTVGYAIFDTSCCGVGGCGFATVRGFLRSWQDSRDAQERPISTVEPIDDPALRREIAKLIRRREPVTQVDLS